MVKRRKLLVATLVALFIASTISIALAEDQFTNTGNDNKGKYLYRKNCRTCHIAGGTAKDLSPNSKTQAQWQRTFGAYEKLACKDEWKKLSQGDLKDTYTYLFNHAYDSPQPATCE
jgi:cytochrome c5